MNMPRPHLCAFCRMYPVPSRSDFCSASCASGVAGGHRRHPSTGSSSKPIRPILKRQVPLPSPSQSSTQTTPTPHISTVPLPTKRLDRKLCAMYGCLELCAGDGFDFCTYSHQYHALIQNKINLACEYCRIHRRREGWNCCTACYKQKVPAKRID